jgi:hypothetical protein
MKEGQTASRLTAVSRRQGTTLRERLHTELGGAMPYVEQKTSAVTASQTPWVVTIR